MQEVRVESLDGLEVRGRELRLSANAGRLRIVFPREVWDHLLRQRPGASKSPTPRSSRSCGTSNDRLEGARREARLRDRPRRGSARASSGLDYDLVLRPAGLLAVTTGYLFAPVVGRRTDGDGSGRGSSADDDRRAGVRDRGRGERGGPRRRATRTSRPSPSGAAAAAPAASRWRRSSGRSSPEASAGRT